MLRSPPQIKVRDSSKVPFLVKFEVPRSVDTRKVWGFLQSILSENMYIPGVHFVQLNVCCIGDGATDLMTYR